MMLQLDPPIPVYVPSKDALGYAIGWIDYSQEHNLIWVVALDNGEVWSIQNPDIRLQPNYTMGRLKDVMKPTQPNEPRPVDPNGKPRPMPR